MIDFVKDRKFLDYKYQTKKRVFVRRTPYLPDHIFGMANVRTNNVYLNIRSPIPLTKVLKHELAHIKWPHLDEEYIRALADFVDLNEFYLEYS